MNRSLIWPRVRRVWATLGISATIVFAVWSLIAYRASPVARAALTADGAVTVTRQEGSWTFVPSQGRKQSTTRLLFFAGSLVDPVAYAPLARAVASAGFAAIIVELPRRVAFGGADDPILLTRARALMSPRDQSEQWVVAGHSRGAVVATQLAAEGADGLAG
nr:hypothetical protein [Gemmatimonadaceae bacterium]